MRDIPDPGRFPTGRPGAPEAQDPADECRAPLKARGMFNPEDPVRPGDLLSIEEDGTVTVTPSAGEQE